VIDWRLFNSSLGVTESRGTEALNYAQATTPEHIFSETNVALRPQPRLDLPGGFITYVS
jgi:hypothetical protein